MDTILAVGGLDPSGCAGLAADQRAIEALGFHAALVAAALTVQNTRSCERVAPVDAELLAAQIEAVASDLRVVAVKSGLLGSPDAVRTLAAAVESMRPRPFVLDPVLRSSTGAALVDEATRGALEADLACRATLVTPNANEAEVLCGRPVRDPDQAAEAGRLLLARGYRAVLVKGGHFQRGRGTDVLVTPEGPTRFEGREAPARHTRGTGCTMACALAARLARGDSLAQAVGAARRFVAAALEAGQDVGGGPGPVGPGRDS